MKLLTTALLLILSANVFAQTKGALENPSQDSYTSGIYMFSGWACDAELIEIVINGGSGLKAAYGTDRGDTRGICGDSDNGFGLLFNMSNLGTGTHTAVAFADGQEFGRSTFNVERMSTGEFLRGEQGFAIDYNFPKDGREVWLEWVESAQNFVIKKEQNTPDPLDISGGWVNDALGVGALITTSRFYQNREEVWVMLAVDDSNWNLFEGYIQGTQARLRTLPPFGADADVTVNFSDTLTGTVTVNSCRSANGYVCYFSSGDRIPIRKAAGNSAGRMAPQDGDSLIPISGSLEDLE